MREYGRWIKNIAAFFLLMALLSLLLPFCRFQAAGEKVELSGMEVLATAGRAGITYARHNEIPDSFVVKEPFTWGEMKNGFSYAQDAVGNKTLLGGAAAIALPVILCVLSMILLAVAEGKKTMVAPTLFVDRSCHVCFVFGNCLYFGLVWLVYRRVQTPPQTARKQRKRGRG